MVDGDVRALATGMITVGFIWNLVFPFIPEPGKFLLQIGRSFGSDRGWVARGNYVWILGRFNVDFTEQKGNLIVLFILFVVVLDKTFIFLEIYLAYQLINQNIQSYHF